MAAYVYPGNLNFRSIQTIPVDTTNKLRQSSNGVDAAQKIQDLHVKVMAGGVELSSTVTCTVASVLATNSKGVVAPAYRVHVNGWTNSAVAVSSLSFLGGFPRAFTSDQNVNPTEASAVLPEGTLTTYDQQTLPDQCLFPTVVLIGGNPVVLKDKNVNVAYPTWNLNATNYCTTASVVNFNFSFNLFVQPGRD